MTFLLESFRQFGVTENVQRAKSILAKQKINPQHEDYQIIRGMLEKKVGWVGLFTYFRFEAAQRVSIDELAQLFDKLMSVEPMLSKLPKTVDKYESFESLTDDLDELLVQRKVTRFYQEMTSVQKASFKKADAESRSRLEMTVVLFYDVLREQQQKDFMKKISAYKTFKTLLTSLENYVEGSMQDFTMESVLALIEETDGGAKVVYRNDAKQRLVIRLHTYEANELLNTATQWCIRDSKGTWDGYVHPSTFNTQYTIYNFTKKFSDITSMIGVTVEASGSYKTAHYKNDSSISEAELKRVAKSQGYLSALKPMEGEELAKAQKSKVVCDNINSFYYEDDDPEATKLYVEHVMDALEDDLLDSDTKGGVLLNLMYAEEWDAVKKLVATDFLDTLSSTTVGEIMNSCFATANTDFLKDLVTKGMKITQYVGHDNYARYLNLTGKVEDLHEWAVKRGGDYEALLGILATRNVELFEWFGEKFCPDSQGDIDPKQMETRLYPVLGYGGGSVPASRLDMPMFRAINPYLKKVNQQQTIYRQLWKAHQDPTMFAIIKEQVENKNLDLLMGISSYKFKENLPYVRGIVEAGFANVTAPVAARIMMVGALDLLEPIVALSEKREDSYDPDGFDYSGMSSDPGIWLTKLIEFAFKNQAYEGMKWLHKRGYVLEGVRLHKFGDMMDDLVFSNRDDTEVDFDPEFVYYMHKQGYPINKFVLADAFARANVDEEDLSSATPKAFVTYMQSRLLECESDADFDKAVAAIRKRFPDMLPLEMLKLVNFVKKNDRVLTDIFGGKVDLMVLKDENADKWLSDFSLAMMGLSKNPGVMRTFQGWGEVTAGEYAALLTNALGTVGGRKEPLTQLIDLLCEFAAEHGKNDEEMQLETYKSVKADHDVLRMKDLLHTSELIAWKALLAAAHTRPLNSFHALNSHGFAGDITLESGKLLLANLAKKTYYATVPTFLERDTLRAILVYRDVTEDLTELLPMLDEFRQQMHPTLRHLIMKELFPNAPQNESYLSDFARFGKRRG